MRERKYVCVFGGGGRVVGVYVRVHRDRIGNALFVGEVSTRSRTEVADTQTCTHRDAQTHGHTHTYTHTHTHLDFALVGNFSDGGVVEVVPAPVKDIAAVGSVCLCVCARVVVCVCAYVRVFWRRRRGGEGGRGGDAQPESHPSGGTESRDTICRRSVYRIFMEECGLKGRQENEEVEGSTRSGRGKGQLQQISFGLSGSICSVHSSSKDPQSSAKTFATVAHFPANPRNLKMSGEKSRHLVKIQTSPRSRNLKRTTQQKFAAIHIQCPLPILPQWFCVW